MIMKLWSSLSMTLSPSLPVLLFLLLATVNQQVHAQTPCLLCEEGQEISFPDVPIVGIFPDSNGVNQATPTTCQEIIDQQDFLTEMECEEWIPVVRANCGCQTISTMAPTTIMTEINIEAAEIDILNNDNNSSTTGGDDSATSSPSVDQDSCVATKDSAKLRDTCRVYGSIFLVIFLVFCGLRKFFPDTYAVRNMKSNKNPTPLADPSYGWFEWISKICRIDENKFQDECGMDALCLVRINYFGFKLCVVCMLNAIWLIPIYATAKTQEETECITDSMQSISISHVPPGSNRLIASTIAAYIIFGFAMYFILGELEWLKTSRHRFLSKQLARNYSVYLRCIPDEYLNNTKLQHYFRRIYNDVGNTGNIIDNTPSSLICVDCHVARKIPNLSKLVSERAKLVGKLEHAMNVERIKDTRPTHSTKLCGGEKVDSIETYSRELEEMNKKAKESIEKLEDMRQQDDNAALGYTIPNAATLDVSSGGTQDDDEHLLLEKQQDTNSSDEEINTADEEATMTENNDKKSAENKTSENDDEDKNAATAFVGKQAAMVTNIIKGETEDGEKVSAAFVSFRSLRAANAAIQMDHSDQPHAMEAFEAPDPADVLWTNVGKTHQQLELGKLLSLVLTVLICLFWTVVIAFAASLSSVEGLRDIGFVDKALNTMPWLEPVLAQIAPFIVVIVNALLKVILGMFSGFELPVSIATLEASLFTKLAWFMIIQNFFVASIGGASAAAYSEFVSDLTAIVDLLGSSLPAQSIFHIQILLVNVFLSMGLELIGVARLVVAWIRQLFGPGLTEKERASPWMGLKPINDPDPFVHSQYTAWNVLYFMVLFVYSTIAPISSFFMALCFLIMWVCFRYLFIYIYPVVPDSGGLLYFSLLNILLISMLIAEVTVLALLGIKQSGVASALVIPLIIITGLFNLYVKQKHFTIAKHLPGEKCLAGDEATEEPFDTSFLKDAYKQPELKVPKKIIPDPEGNGADDDDDEYGVGGKVDAAVAKSPAQQPHVGTPIPGLAA